MITTCWRVPGVPDNTLAICLFSRSGNDGIDTSYFQKEDLDHTAAETANVKLHGRLSSH